MVLYDFRNEENLSDNVAEIHFHKNAYPGLHGHNYWEIIILIEGEIHHRIKQPQLNIDHSYVMQQYDYCMLPPRFFHQFQNIPGKTSQHINLSASADFAVSVFDLFGNFANEHFPPNRYYCGKLTIEKANYFIENANKMLIAKKDNMEEKKILPKIAFLEFINILIGRALLPSPPPIYPEWFSTLLATLNRVENINLTIPQICKLRGYGQRQLLRTFKTYLGTTITGYMTDVKFNYCCSLLANTNYTMVNICERLQYSSVSHFNKLFKQRFNMTPSEYRKKYNVLHS